MQQQRKLESRRGLLLVEAVLSAVVITLGLVFINRAMGGQLGAVRRIEHADETASLARRSLLEFEALCLAGPPPAAREGTFDEPADAYRWAMSAEPRADLVREDGTPEALTVAVRVERDAPGSSAIVTALWPAAWVP
jgi:hypothetical protein